MKKLIILLFCTFSILSCEEVVDLDLQTAAPRLVVDASFQKFQDEHSTAKVTLTTTFGYYSQELPFINDAEVTVTDSNGNFYLLENYGEGRYSAPIEIEEDLEYFLTIIHEGETYTASASYVPVPPIEYLEQLENGGFTGDEPEVRAYVTDPAGEENFYFVEIKAPPGNIYDAFNDQFVDGNSFDLSYSHEDLQAGDNVSFRLHGVDEQAYNYLFTLLQQKGGSGGPFSTQPATVHGNIINQTNPDNYALGYFRVSGVFVVNYMFE